jgi:hypothetical protein
MKTISLMLVLVMGSSGCATVRNHPKLSGAIGGGAVGIGIAFATRRGTCASMYDGKPYSGTPPCPVDVKGSKR